MLVAIFVAWVVLSLMMHVSTKPLVKIIDSGLEDMAYARIKARNDSRLAGFHAYRDQQAREAHERLRKIQSGR